jgi:inorganic pyrophosphatase
VAQTAFWQRMDDLVAACPLIIDRPRGSRHPGFADFRYPFDYGYLSGTQSGDGQSIDVWIGSQSSRTVMAVVCTLDLMQRNAEIKLLIGCTVEEAKQIVALHNTSDQSAILVVRR